MLELFRDPVWQGIGAVVSILSFVLVLYVERQKIFYDTEQTNPLPSQNLIIRHNKGVIRWLLWLQWVSITALGAIVGFYAADYLTESIYGYGKAGSVFLSTGTFGGLVALVQSLLLRRYWRNFGWWIIVNFVTAGFVTMIGWNAEDSFDGIALFAWACTNLILGLIILQKSSSQAL